MSSNNMFAWYEGLYRDVINSKTYSKYCETVFGIDLSQQGFSDKEQLDLLISKLHIGTEDRVLDIGCGIGRIDEYIHSYTGANIIGIDASPTAIDIASSHNHNKLQFECINMDDICYLDGSFDAILCIDAIFFSDDIELLLSKLYRMLKNGGYIGILYFEIIFDDNTANSILLAENTPVARSYKNLGLSYSYNDLTEQTYYHMIGKRLAAEKLKDEFIAEGNEYLYEYIARESIAHDMKFEQFKEKISRYLYIVEKRKIGNENKPHVDTRIL
ncbi:MAG: class I SAM-dependent methyltransferase [Oscillospiraceae bacterium]|nr:class I SAM-dependent methyltransferase [Oscillospiraceae bacterium]